MSKHLRYLSYVVRHKWFVLVAGLRVGAPLWRLLIHDWSKFTPSEWRPYVLSFYGPGGYANRPPDVVAAFDRAWLHHQHANPHHWQHWVLREDSPSGEFYLDTAEQQALTLNLYGLHLATFHNVNNLARHYAHKVLNDLNTKVLEMPEHFAREMVADWMGAGRAITGRWDVASWYAKNRDRIMLGPNTADLVERLIADATPTMANPNPAPREPRP